MRVMVSLTRCRNSSPRRYTRLRARGQAVDRGTMRNEVEHVHDRRVGARLSPLAKTDPRSHLLGRYIKITERYYAP